MSGCCDGNDSWEWPNVLLARIILAFQAETGLTTIGLNCLFEYIKTGSEKVEHFGSVLPINEADLKLEILKLERAGLVCMEGEVWVSVSSVGLLICGPVEIPEEIADSFGEKIEARILRRA